MHSRAINTFREKQTKLYEHFKDKEERIRKAAQRQDQRKRDKVLIYCNDQIHVALLSIDY